MNAFFQNHTIGLIFFLMPCIVPVVICIVYGLCKYDFKFCCNRSTSRYEQFDTEAASPTQSLVILLPGKHLQTQDISLFETEDGIEQDQLFLKSEESMNLIRQKAKELEMVLEPQILTRGMNDAGTTNETTNFNERDEKRAAKY